MSTYNLNYGHNAKDNCTLIPKSDDNDWWFHANDGPSSHVFLQLGQDVELSKEMVQEASKLVKSSTSRIRNNSKKIPVIYTPIKNLRYGDSVGSVIFSHCDADIINIAGTYPAPSLKPQFKWLPLEVVENPPQDSDVNEYIEKYLPLWNNEYMQHLPIGMGFTVQTLHKKSRFYIWWNKEENIFFNPRYNSVSVLMNHDQYWFHYPIGQWETNGDQLFPRTKSVEACISINKPTTQTPGKLEYHPTRNFINQAGPIPLTT